MERSKYVQPKNLIDPQYAKDIDALEILCKKSGHIGQKENLLDVISKDDETLKKYNIIPEQIYDFFVLLKSSLSLEKFDPEYIGKIPEFIREYRTKAGISTAGWSCRCIMHNVFKLHDVSFDVYRAVYGGAESCPIYGYYNEKSYHGYSWGCSDWFFINIQTNEMMHISDLLPLQIINYGFFQGSDSKYRVCPEKLIKFFGFKPNTNYSPKYRHYKSYNLASHSNFVDTYPHPIKKEDILYENELVTIASPASDNPKYHIFVVRKNDNVERVKREDIIVEYNGAIINLPVLYGASYYTKELTDQKEYIEPMEKNIYEIMGVSATHNHINPDKIWM